MRILKMLLVFFGICMAKDLETFHTRMGGDDIYVLSVKERPIQESILLPENGDVKQYKSRYSVNQQNIMAIKSSKFIALIDTGFEDSIDYMLHALQKIGIESNQVTHIILTHAHRDHIGGISIDNKRIFPNAKLFIDKNEYDYLIASDAEDTKIKLASYGDDIEFFDPNNLEILKDKFITIKAINAYGHTPGHNLISIESNSANNDKIIFFADLLHIFDIQLEHPDIPVMYDVDKTKAIQTRYKFLQMFKQERIKVIGSHVPFVKPVVLQN